MTKYDKRNEVLERLNNFKELVRAHERSLQRIGRTRVIPTSMSASLRSEINSEMNWVRQQLRQVNCFRTLTIAPPAMIGGLIARNVDPLEGLFNAPYGHSTNELVCDMIDQAMGIISEHGLPKTNAPGAKGRKSGADAAKNKSGVQILDSKKVFVVHGHDDNLKNAVARFLACLGLEPIILHERPDGGQTVIEKFESEARVSFAVVLATADDPAPGSAPSSEPTRARQNVIFELGYFRGVLPKGRVVLIKDDGTTLPSDLSGVVYALRTRWQAELLRSLIQAGYTFSSPQTSEALAIRD